MSRRLVLVMMSVLVVQAWGASSAAASTANPMATADPMADAMASALDCGDAGQVACIKLDLTYGTPFHGCTNDRLNNLLNVCYSCGGLGQAACDFGPKCDAGGRNLFGICSYSGYSSEPTTNVKTQPGLTQPATGPVRGIVDMHAHQFSNLGFGGVLFWGAPYDAGGINEALPWCDYSWKYSTTIDYSGAPGPQLAFFGNEIHGTIAVQPLAHPISLAVEEGLHEVNGTGQFEGWPTYETMTHQQMYYKWVERAFLGGVRMMVQLAVSNEALCGAGKRRSDFSCDDMEAVDKQIQATKDLETAIDTMDDGQVNGSGWYRVAYTPAQARTFIRAGKMAVVLGIEVDSLFGCKPGSSCSETYIKAQLQKYYNLGVRHVFPIHQYDNAFGGSAIFRDELNAANRIVSGHHFQVRNCSAQGYTYNVNSSIAADFLAFILHGATPPDQSYYDQYAADCNSRGLTTAGRQLINAMMDTGFIIDVDHMSRLMLDEVLAIAQQRNYPLVSGHSKFHGGQGGSEFSLTDAQMAAFKQIGGMVSAINPKGKCGTSEGFAYHYRAGVAGMQQAPGDRFAAVGFSTDMNGFGGSTGPRFGEPGCPGTPGTELEYPFTGIMGGSFNMQHTGDRDFDFNYQGLAHYGQLADFFADVRNNFLSAEELEPLLNSAESYIRLWTRATPGASQPAVKAIVTGTQSPGAVAYVSDVHVTWEVTGGGGYDIARSGCGNRNITQDTGHSGITYTCKADAYYEDSDGSRVVVGTAEASVTILRDTTPPTLAWGMPSPAATAAGWHNATVTFPFTVADATTGVSKPPSLVLSTEGQGITGTVTVTDWAGNSATFTSPPVNIDKTAPEIVFVSHVPAPNAAGWNRENPTLTWSCADALSGPVAAQVSRTLTLEGAGRTLIGQCLDLAGNATDDKHSDLKLDRTPPTIAWMDALPAANAAGWHHADVTLVFTTADSLSGVASTSQASPLLLAAEGAAVTGAVTVTDAAGNVATFTSPAASIDKTVPVISFVSHLPAVNGAGWNREHPTVTWACADALSGPSAAQVSKTLVSEGAGQALTGQCTDVAGNAATETRGGLNLDTTPPTLDWAAASPAANPAGWHNSDVAFGFVPTDSLSGVAGTSLPSPLVLVAEGAAVTGAVSVTDVAGNTASFTTPFVRIDKTAPSIACTADPAFVWPPNGRFIPVNVALTVTDALAGTQGFSLISTESNEPGSGTIANFTLGAPDLSGSVQARRLGGGAGRTYTFGYRGLDLAGNGAECTTTVRVPHDRSEQQQQ